MIWFPFGFWIVHQQVGAILLHRPRVNGFLENHRTLCRLQSGNLSLIVLWGVEQRAYPTLRAVIVQQRSVTESMALEYGF